MTPATTETILRALGIDPHDVESATIHLNKGRPPTVIISRYVHRLDRAGERELSTRSYDLVPRDDRAGRTPRTFVDGDWWPPKIPADAPALPRPSVTRFLDPSAKALGPKLQDLKVDPERPVQVSVSVDSALLGPGVTSVIESEGTGMTRRKLSCAGCGDLLAVGDPGMKIDPMWMFGCMNCQTRTRARTVAQEAVARAFRRA